MAFNGLTAAEDERLSLLVEECAEVIQIAMKIQRHGYSSHHPDDEGDASGNFTTNRQLLETELGHVQAAYELMLHEGDVVNGSVRKAMFNKLSHVRKYLHHQPAAMFAGMKTDYDAR